MCFCDGKMPGSVISAQLSRAERSFSQGVCSYSCCTRLCSLVEHVAWNKSCRWSLLSLQQTGEVRETRSKENKYSGLKKWGRWTWTLGLTWVSASGWGHGEKFIFLSSDRLPVQPLPLPELPFSCRSLLHPLSLLFQLALPGLGLSLLLQALIPLALWFW